VTPKNYFITYGIGIHKDKLISFEFALRKAGIAEYNLVGVSSILPPMCKKISIEDGKAKLSPGQIIHCVLSRNETDEAERVLCAAVGVATPEDNSQYGYIAELHMFGKTEIESKDWVEDRAAELLASTLGIEIDWQKAWDEKTDTYTIKDRKVDTESVCAYAKGVEGSWVSVVAAIVFIE
jgi:arginine decarboxylase